MKLKFLFLVLLLSSFGLVQAGKQQPLRLATTTSTQNSGLLDFLLPAFTRESGYEVHVIAVGTGKALRMGCDGDADVVLVHAPQAEKAFVAQGCGVERHTVMVNDFVIVGPVNDPAGTANGGSAVDALQRIARHQSLFISRGDDSGTHKKERDLWRRAGIRPAGDWYREAGQGMGKVLQMAGELDAYTLTDRATWLAYQARLPLRITFAGDPVLLNPYSIIAVNPQKYPDGNHAGANALIGWLTSAEGQQKIAAFTVDGTQLFRPTAVKTSRQASTP